jgi:hypothetical protein
MLKQIAAAWDRWSTDGFRAPYIHDPVSKKPSITLLFPYLTFTLAFISTILLHFHASLFLATITSIIFWVISVIFYQLRKLQKAKFDLDDKSFELDSGEN